MPRIPRALVAAAAALALALASTGPAPGRSSVIAPRILVTRGAVESLAVDGARIAFDLASFDNGCNTLHVWEPLRGTDVVVSGPATCEADSTSTGAGVREIALAGRRVAWIVNLGGNTESTDTLYTAVVRGSREHRVASATRRGDVDGELDGGWLGNLAGDASLIVLNRWTTAGGTVMAASLRRLRRGLVPLHTGSRSLAVHAVDNGRIAVVGGDGTIIVYDASGTEVASVTPTAPAREVALHDDDIVALEPGRLEVWSTATGLAVKTLPTPSGARHLDIHANIATFSIGRRVYGVRLDTGRQATLATAPKAIVDVRIDDAGLVYAFNRTTGVRGTGSVVFLPLALVRRTWE